MLVTILLFLSMSLFFGAGVFFVLELFNIGCACIALGSVTSIALVATLLAMIINKLDKK